MDKGMVERGEYLHLRRMMEWNPFWPSRWFNKREYNLEAEIDEL